MSEKKMEGKTDNSIIGGLTPAVVFYMQTISCIKVNIVFFHAYSQILVTVASYAVSLYFFYFILETVKIN